MTAAAKHLSQMHRPEKTGTTQPTPFLQGSLMSQLELKREASMIGGDILMTTWLKPFENTGNR
jgi:hypothetical protein